MKDKRNSKEDLAYADGYYDGLRHGKQSARKRETMEDENQMTDARRLFESHFKHAQPRLSGSEEETIVYKQMAWGWFQMGRGSTVKELRGKLVDLLENLKTCE